MGERECPACGRTQLVSGREALAVYQTASWGANALLADARVVCSFCKWVRLEDGTETRLMSARQRAYELNQADARSRGVRYWVGEIGYADDDDVGVDPSSVTGSEW